MNDVKQEWQRTQLNWDDRDALQSRRIPRSVVLNWRKMTRIMRCLCEEKHLLQGHKLTVVDIGSGPGKFWNGLETSVELCIGIDPSSKMLDRIASSRDRLFIRGAGECLPLQPGIADVVLIKSVLDQCYAPQQVIQESHRVLKNDGWLLISLSNRNAYYAFLRNLYSYLRRHRSKHFFQDSHQFYFDMTNLLGMLNEQCFEIARRISIGYFVFPRSLEWLLPERVLLRCIDLADKAGAFILPRRGGIFILVGKPSKDE